MGGALPLSFGARTMVRGGGKGGEEWAWLWRA